MTETRPLTKAQAETIGDVIGLLLGTTLLAAWLNGGYTPRQTIDALSKAGRRTMFLHYLQRGELTLPGHE